MMPPLPDKPRIKNNEKGGELGTSDKEQGKRRFYANEVPILCELLNLTFDEIYTNDSAEQEKKLSLEFY